MADGKAVEAMPTSPADWPDTAWLKRILTARVYDVAIESPLQPAPKLSARLGVPVLFKREDLQPVHSFKLRGAYQRIAGLSAEERARGVLAVSAGNHAQGVALAAQRLGIDAVIVMPKTTPPIKIDAVRAYGATIELVGDSYDDAAQHGRSRAAAEGRVMVHPYDDADVIAGQATVGLELLRQLPPGPARVFVPVGGGGLCAGVAVLLTALRPEIEVIAVEPVDAACLAAALAAGSPVDLAQVGLFVDGCAVKRIGALNFALLRPRLTHPVLTAGVDAVCAAIRDVFEATRNIVEPSGALALAGLKSWVEQHGADPDLPHVAILSGANLNFDRLRHVAERAEIGEATEALYGVGIPEERGSFLAFARALGRRAVTEFNYRYAGPGAAQIFVGIRLRQGERERREVAEHLRRHGYPVEDYSDNELAGLHIRHLVGGRVHSLRERCFRFVFPERPGALEDFLVKIGDAYNITLFHYRNHGAAYGRVFAALEVAAEQDADLDDRLAALGFEYAEESANPAVRRFLG
jgi:threonine dehydratase